MDHLVSFWCKGLLWYLGFCLVNLEMFPGIWGFSLQWVLLPKRSIFKILNMKLGRTDQAKGIISKMQQKRQKKVFSSVHSLSSVWLFVTPWTAAGKASLSITNSLSLLKLMFIESVMPSNHLILCHPLLLLPSVFTSISFVPPPHNESVIHIRWPKY